MENQEQEKRQTALSHFTDMHMKVQKVRLATGSRLTQLQNQGRSDKRVERILEMTTELEETFEDFIAEEFKSHPTYPWTSRIKGCGMEAAAKVIGIIEGVRFKETGRQGIEAFDRPSKLRRFAGLAPIDGKAERVSRGEKGLHYSPELRMMLWRLLRSLMRAERIWYEKYLENDDYYMMRFNKDGIKVEPTPSGRYCPGCQEIKEVPTTTTYCPDCGEKLMKKLEPSGVVWRGHVVAMAKRRTIRLWLDMLLIVWRQALGLPIRSPYIVQYGGHELIDPWEMVDK